jgi:3-oxoadipate CoA-transferase alpha subunit
MLDKTVNSLSAAVEGVKDGATILLGGFMNMGFPIELLDALADNNVKELTIVANNPNFGEQGLTRLMNAGSVRKLMCSFPRLMGSDLIERLTRSGTMELELVPQGTLAERVRSAGAGIPGFYTRTAVGTIIAEGKEHREFDGQTYIFEPAIRGDVAFIKAVRGDRWGNLVYNKATRNFNPVMAMSADLTIAQVAEIVDNGAIDPETVVTPGIFVDRVVQVGNSS